MLAIARSFKGVLRYLLLALLGGLALPAAGQAAPPAPLVSLPFDVVSGVVVLRNLLFNGRRGDFILDTGCTYGLVVEQAAFPSQVRPLAKSGLGAAGATSLYELPVTQFEFGDVRPPQTAQATSLASLRAAVGPQLLGLIGTGLLRRFEVVIDYAHRRLSLYALGPQQSQVRPFTRHDSVAFTLEKGWPVTVASIKSVPVQLLLDTGARDNYLDTDFAQSLPAGTRPTGAQRETVLAPGGRVAAQRARLPILRVGTTEWRGLAVLLAPPVRYLSGRQLPYQGVLGESFLSQQPLVSFHFGRQQFYVLARR
jgi:predicted aspartyl protease